MLQHSDGHVGGASTSRVAPAHVDEYTSLAASYVTSAPVDKYITPAPAVSCVQHPPCSTAPVMEYIAPSASYITPAPVVEHVAPAESNVTPAPVNGRIEPVSAVDAAPAPFVKYLSHAAVGGTAPGPVNEHVVTVCAVDAALALVVEFFMPAAAGECGT